MPTTGTITQVIGSTFDAQFPENEIPQIYNAVTVEFELSGQRYVYIDWHVSVLLRCAIRPGIRRSLPARWCRPARGRCAPSPER